MKKQLKVKEETERLFQNNLLEKLTRTSPTLTATYYGSLITFLVYLHIARTADAFGISLLFFFGALLSWTLFEYILHRYLFHFISENKAVKRFHYLVHGVHHQNPQDEARIFMPPVPGTIILSIFFGFFYLLFADRAFIVTAGFLSGYGIYVFIHYMVHAFKPVKGFRYLWVHHAKHHFKDDTKAYGVSSPFWDYVFRTMPD